MIAIGRDLGKGGDTSYLIGMGKIFASFLIGFMVAAGTGAADQDDPRLEDLFIQLRSTSDLAQASKIQRDIWLIWIEGKTAEVNTVMARGIDEMSIGDYPAALRYFSDVVNLAPGLAEGWNKRATVLYLMGDYDGSVHDIQKTLALEPRHWGALSGLGLINMRLERVDQAIKAFEEAVTINPHLLGTKVRIKELRAISKGKPT
jgi:tetratricopeptide (TPR) repeat protein